jgi:hypothetical protein
LDVTAPLELLTPAQDDETWTLTVGVAWEQPLRAQGGQPPLAWAVEGALPPGVELDLASERLIGAPTQAGEARLVIRVTDASDPPQEVSRSARILVASPPLQITTEALPSAVLQTPYGVPLEATGGAGDNAWSIASGALPPGITLSAAGVLEGTPTSAGLSRFSVQVQDAQRQTARKDLQIEGDASPPDLHHRGPARGPRR